MGERRNRVGCWLTGLALAISLLPTPVARAQTVPSWEWGERELHTDLQNLLACITWINAGELNGGDGPDPSEFWRGCLAATKLMGSSSQLQAAKGPSDFPRLEFDVGSDDIPLPPQTLLANTLEALGLLLNQSTTRTMQVRLIGHASCLSGEDGPEGLARNLHLSWQRARFIQRALASNKYTRNNRISGQRIATEGRGYFERHNGGNFDGAECKKRSIGHLSETESKEELAQQRVEVRVESPLLVRWGLAATDQIVGRLVNDERLPKAALLPRGFPRGLLPGIYHSVDLSSLHPAFRLPTALPKECWSRGTNWTTFNNVATQNSDGAPLDRSELGVLSLRVRIGVRETATGRQASLLLDVTGRIPSWGENEPVPPLLAKTILSLPAYWALEQRLPYILQPILTSSASDIASGIDNLPEPTHDNTLTRKLEFYQVLAKEAGPKGDRNCQPLIASEPKAKLDSQLNEALGALIRGLPQTHEDMLARLSGVHPQLGYTPVKVGERICVHPSQLSVVDGRVEYGWASESCAHLINIGVPDTSPRLQFSSADNPFPQRYGAKDATGELPLHDGVRWVRTWAEAFIRPLPERALILRPIDGLLKSPPTSGFNDDNSMRSFMLIGYNGEGERSLATSLSSCNPPDPTTHVQCATIPFGGELRLQVPVHMAVGRTFWDLGTTIGEIGDTTGRAERDVVSAARGIKAFRSTFGTGERLVIDNSPDLIRRLPVTNGDTIPW